LSNDIIEEWRKEKEELMKRVKSDKKLNWLTFEIKSQVVGFGLLDLIDAGIIKPWKTPEEIRHEKELARVKRFEESLSPDDLKVRRELIHFLADFNFEAHLCFYTPPHSYHIGPFVDKCFEKGKLLGKKYPIERVRKVLTPKEFEEIKKLLYPEDKSN